VLVCTLRQQISRTTVCAIYL